MLRELHIKKFALIDEFHIEFKEGLNVLTGETGAGKSIIISALNLALGCRADPDFIRQGSDSASVEALFSLQGRSGIKEMAMGFGVDLESNDLIIKRVVSRSGKNRLFLNGSMAPLSTLSAIGDRLADIHGQHQHQSLLLEENHSRFLDSFARLEKEVAELRGLEAGYRGLKRQVGRKEERERENARLKDRLRYEISEIEGADLSPDEEEEVGLAVEKLRNAESLFESVNSALRELYDSDASVIDLLRRILSGLASSAEIDPELALMSDTANSIMIQTDDLSTALRHYAHGIEFNQERLEEMEERLDAIHSLKRKYGPSIAAILEYLYKAKSRMAALENEEENLEKVETELVAIRGELQDRATRLARKREEAAKKFSRLIKKELKEMGMDKVEFSVFFNYEHDGRDEFSYNGKGVKLNADGFGRAEFLFSSNAGEKPRPLSKIASGGEISRVMLALKTLLPGRDDVLTMVFDEVDSGIGGKVAEMVGLKLMNISRERQVLCITHLPQIAGMAGVHFVIEKSVSRGRTSVSIRELGREDRIDEIARMSGGSVITETTKRHAEEMIRSVDRKKSF